MTVVESPKSKGTGLGVAFVAALGRSCSCVPIRVMGMEMASADEDWITQKLLILGGGRLSVRYNKGFIILT